MVEDTPWIPVEDQRETEVLEEETKDPKTWRTYSTQTRDPSS